MKSILTTSSLAYQYHPSPLAEGAARFEIVGTVCWPASGRWRATGWRATVAALAPIGSHPPSHRAVPWQVRQWGFCAVMLRTRGPLAEVQLNCQLRQENGGAKAHARRARRPVVRTPNKTQDRPAEAPAPTVWTGSSTSASAIGTKIPARVSATQLEMRVGGQTLCHSNQRSDSLSVTAARAAPTTAPVAHVRPSPPPPIQTNQLPCLKDNSDSSMDELKARIQRSQAALQQLTKASGQRPDNIGGHSAGSGGIARPTACSMDVPRGRNESILDVRERLIRADAQLQLLAALAEETATVPPHRGTRPAAELNADRPVGARMASDE